MPRPVHSLHAALLVALATGCAAPIPAPSLTRPGATPPSATPPSATPPSATPPSATPPSATRAVDPAPTLQLADELAAGRLRLVGRTARPLADGGRTVVRLDSLGGYGVAWLDHVTLADGTIEVELRGANHPGASFVGVAFHGASDSTYEAVYVRPFNFGHADSTSRAHSVQYVSHPAHTWRRLRDEHPGVYEAAIEPAPDRDGWVRLRIVVAHPTVRVHVNGAERPSLVVRQLGEQRRGRVGLWVGHPSRGDFATLRVVPGSGS